MYVLASSSPRRKQLLKEIIDDFIVVPSNFDESIFLSLSPEEAVKNISIGKGQEVHKRYPNDVVISADTIVVLNNKIIGKPKDKEDAIRILKELSDNTHTVITSYCLFYKDKFIQNEVISHVKMNKLPESLIIEYVNTGSPLDKAGAYGVQDNENYHLISKVDGSLTNVIGFPVDEIRNDLNKILND